MKMIEVGTTPWEDNTGKRFVSELNKELFDLFKNEAANSAGTGWHIGYVDIGHFVDLLEQRYDIKKKESCCGKEY